jgi:hypothetical protein
VSSIADFRIFNPIGLRLLNELEKKKKKLVYVHTLEEGSSWGWSLPHNCLLEVQGEETKGGLRRK